MAADKQKAKVWVLPSRPTILEESLVDGLEKQTERNDHHWG